MTDKEIIKALECCANLTISCKCKNCAYDDTVDCYKALSEDTTDLIKRQQEEIERFADIGKINWQRELLDDKCDRCIARDRAEAIKDFALKIKVRMHKWAYYYGGYYDIFTEKEIDDLVKEMVSDGND